MTTDQHHIFSREEEGLPIPDIMIKDLAEIITGYRYDLYEGKNSQSKVEYVYYLQHRWQPLAKRVLEPDALDLSIPTTDKPERLAELVIILPDKEKVQKDDLIDTDFGFGFVTEVKENNFNLALHQGTRDTWKDGTWFRNFGDYKIIQRNGKPVIYQSALVAKTVEGK